MNNNSNYIYKWLAFFSLSLLCFANQDSISYYFDPISVLGKNQNNHSQFQVYVVKSNILKIKSNNLNLNSAIESVPGVTAFSDQNFAQDTRLSIRGVGLRSSFGIRGIKVFLDGVPESTPDGQAQLDAIDLIFLSRIDIFKNPTSSVFGNASGAAINLISNPISNKRKNKFNIYLGSYDSRKVNIELNGLHKSFKWRINGLHKFSKGFRQHSSTESNILNMGTEFILNGNQRFKISLNNLFSPFSFDPGSLLLQEANEDRSMARASNIEFESGESVFQSKFSIIYNSSIFKKYDLKSYFFYKKRQFQNKLPFQSGGQNEIKRDYIGLSSIIAKESTFLSNNNKISVGFEYLDQLDLRSRYDNIQGRKGQLVYKKDESYRSFGLFLDNILTLKKRHIVKFAIRYDLNLIGFKDYVIKGDADIREYHSISPSIGLKFQMPRNSQLFLNFSQNFETPTLYELGNDPLNTNGGGINNSLEPQNSFSSEIGFEKKLRNAKIKWFLFQTNTVREIIPFELNEIPGRTFYRNSGKTSKEGYELEIIGIRDTQKTVCTGVEMFRKLLDTGEAGDNIGALLRGIDRDQVERGQVLAKPGSIKPHTKFEAEAYILKKEEGGRHTPFFTKYRPQFYFRTTDVTGEVELPAGTEMVMPGDDAKFTVKLITPIAMAEKLNFAIREGGRTVGAGVITKIIE